MFKMSGTAPREVAAILQREGEVKVQVQVETCSVKGTLLDDERHSITATIIEQNGEYASHMVKAKSEIQLVVDRITWGPKRMVLVGWGGEDPR